MFIRSPAVVWGYVTLVMLFSALNIMGLPYPGPSAPIFSFYRDQNKNCRRDIFIWIMAT